MKIKELAARFTRAHWLFLLLALVFGVVFTYLTPPLWGADENAHFARAYQISKGELLQHKVTVDGKTSAGGKVPESFTNLNTLVSADIEDNPLSAHRQVDSYRAYMDLSNKPVSEEKMVANAYGSIVYPPITYIAPAIGMFIANIFNPSTLTLLYSARLATLVLYIALVFLSLYILRRTSAKWIVFVVSLLPMSIYNASVVSADSALLGLSLVFLSLMYVVSRSEYKTRKRDLFGLAISAILLTVIKPPYVILVLPLLAIPLKSVISKRLRLIIRFLIPALCIVIAGLSFIINSTGTASVAPGDISTVAQLHHILHSPLGYINVLINSVTSIDWVSQILGLFGASFIIIPGIFSQILLIILALTVFIKAGGEADEHLDKRSGLLYLFAGLLTAIIIVTTLYLAWTPVGGSIVMGVQGRYFLPAVAFIMLGIRTVLRQRLVVSGRILRWVYFAAMAFCLLASLLWYYKILYLR